MSAKPLQQADRIYSLDVLRGAAVLGILLMNIWSFVWPREVHDYPFLLADFPGATVETWIFIKTFFEDSQRTLFSILFGAGALLLTARLETKEDISPAKIYYRRTILLILFGLINGYIFLWPADILFVYGICGLFLYPARHLGRPALLVLAICILAVPNTLSYFEYKGTVELKERAEQAQSLRSEGRALSEEQSEAITEWETRLNKARPTFTEDLQEDIRVMKEGSYGEIFQKQAISTLLLQTIVALRSFIWDALGAMLIGMFLYRSGFLTLEKSRGLYFLTALVAYGIGIPISYWEASTMVTSNFEPVAVESTKLAYDTSRLVMALAHASLILWICKSTFGQAIKRGLAATGQMAFTNYLTQSLLGALIFYGIGLGFYGDLPGFYMYLAVAGIWALQVRWSVLWLKRFGYGPFEWLWRKLTYGSL